MERRRYGLRNILSALQKIYVRDVFGRVRNFSKRKARVLRSILLALYRGSTGGLYQALLRLRIFNDGYAQKLALFRRKKQALCRQTFFRKVQDV